MYKENETAGLLSLIVPCFNEERSLPVLYQEIIRVAELLKPYEVEMLFVDDGSTDETKSVIMDFARNDNRVRYYGFSRNFGKEAAMYAGFCNAKGDYVAVMDADMQDPPSLLPEMLRILKAGGRQCRNKKGGPGGRTGHSVFFCQDVL